MSKQFNTVALRFIVLMGIVSLFADMTYEGARSISGPYLALLGASGTIVGFVSGFGELIGYSLRLCSGYVSDRLRSYWGITILGFAINLFAVPLLALTGSWPSAALLLIVERVGKAIRVPPRDAMLSHAAHQVGSGYGFGLHNLLDQIGAVVGPVSLSAILFLYNDYKLGFVFLLLPAQAAFVTLLLSHRLYPNPKGLAVSYPKIDTQGFKPQYWLYITAISLIGAGFIDFPLIAYHFGVDKIVTPGWIPLIYAIAMAVEGLTSLVLGRWFDRQGMIVLIISTGLSACAAPLVFLGNFSWAIVGMVLWGTGMGGQSSIMRALVAHFVGAEKRATAYGLFHLWFGMAWFAGSFLMGYLYDVFIPGLIIFSMAIQLGSLPILWKVRTQLAPF